VVGLAAYRSREEEEEEKVLPNIFHIL